MIDYWRVKSYSDERTRAAGFDGFPSEAPARVLGYRKKYRQLHLIRTCIVRLKHFPVLQLIWRSLSAAGVLLGFCPGSTSCITVTLLQEFGLSQLSLPQKSLLLWEGYGILLHSCHLHRYACRLEDLACEKQGARKNTRVL